MSRRRLGRGLDARRSAIPLLALVAGVTLAGCMPLPLPFHRAPRVHGALVRGGEPVADAAVWWAGTGASRGGQRAPEVCENEESLVESAADGSFTLPEKRGFLILVPLLPFHCMHRWNVCVSLEGQTRSLPVFGYYGICGTGGPTVVTTTCDLDAATADACTSRLGGTP
jgi:hypothetical protein